MYNLDELLENNRSLNNEILKLNQLIRERDIRIDELLKRKLPDSISHDMDSHFNPNDYLTNMNN